MGKITLIIGGARSGKSSQAVKMAKSLKTKTAFLATAIPFDEEMRDRIKKHKLSRPRSWKVVEEPKEILKALGRVKKDYDLIIVDCLGLWISNLLMDNLSDALITARARELACALRKFFKIAIVVSNDVGAGIVPESALGRRFRDIAGIVNQAFAKTADNVIFMQAGIPLKIK